MGTKNETKKQPADELKKTHRHIIESEPPKIEGMLAKMVQPESVDKCLLILQELPDIVYKISPDGYFTFINGSVRSLGYEPKELIGRHFSKIIHADDIESFSRKHVLPKYKGKITGDVHAPKLFDERRTGERRTRNLIVRLLPKKQQKEKMRIGEVIAFGDISSVGHYDAISEKEKRKFLGTLGIIRDITERKRIEEALKKSREYFLAVTENSSDIIIIVDKKGIITYASPSIERFSGYKKEELIGKSGFNFIVTTDLPRAIRDFAKAILKKDIIIPNAFRIRHKDGSERVFEGLGKNLLDDPVIAGFIMNVRDITERKKAEEALKESNEKYRCLVEGMHDGLMQVDNDDRILFVNEQICKILGYTEKELLGKIGCKIFFSESDQRIIRKYNKRRFKKLHDKYEIKMKKKSGEFIWVQISGSPIIRTDGRVLGSISVIADIEQRRHAEEALRKSEEKYRDLVENINDVIYAVGQNGIFTYISPVIKSISGYSPSAIIGKPFTDFIYPEHLPFVKRRFQELINGEQGPAEYKIITKSGDARWIRSFSKPIYKGNRLIGIQGVITDIDQRKQMEEKLLYQADMLQNVSDAIISTDLDFRIRTWNKAAERIYGWEASEAIGRLVHKITKLNYPYDQQDRIVEKLLKDGFWQGEVIQARKDGTKINVQTAVVLMKDSKGKSIGVVAVNRDITAYKKIDEKLRESEEKYRNLFETAPDSIITADLEGKIVTCNQTFQQLTGYSKNEIIGKHFTKLPTMRIHDISKYVTMFSSLLRGKEIKPFEFEWIDKNGSLRNGDIRVSTIKQFGKIAGFQMIVRDVTEQKLANQTLSDTNVRLQLLHKITTSVHSTLNLKEIFKQITEGLVNSLGFTSVFIMMLDETKENFTVKSFFAKKWLLNKLDKIIELPFAHFSFAVNARPNAFIKSVMKGKVGITSDLTVMAYPLVSKKVSSLLQKLGGTKNYMVVPLKIAEKVVGGVIITSPHSEISENEIKLVQIITNNAAHAINNASAHNQTKEAENKLRNALAELNIQRTRMAELTKKIINAQREERRNLVSVIHDEFLQGIVSILYFLQAIDVSSLGKEAREEKEKLMETVKVSIEKGRALISEIEPIRELSIGMIEAIRNTVVSRFGNTAVRVRFNHPKKMPQLNPDVETSVFRIVQEALINIHRHARATSVVVKILVNKHELDIEVSDNGVGFVPELVVRKKVGHYGLLSMQERAHLLGGNLDVISKPGKGTTIRFTFSIS